MWYVMTGVDRVKCGTKKAALDYIAECDPYGEYGMRATQMVDVKYATHKKDQPKRTLDAIMLTKKTVKDRLSKGKVIGI